MPDKAIKAHMPNLVYQAMKECKPLALGLALGLSHLQQAVKRAIELGDKELLEHFHNAGMVESSESHNSNWVPESRWSDHPDYPPEDWTYEVGNGDTRLGYVEWVNIKLQALAESGLQGG
jgi:hypothetical protein